MGTLFSSAITLDTLIFSGILGSLLYTGWIYMIRANERATASFEYRKDRGFQGYGEKPVQDEMDREPGGI
jgi:hypothetical protein